MFLGVAGQFLVTEWHEIFSGVLFRELPIFCVSREQMLANLDFRLNHRKHRGFLASFSLVFDVQNT